MAILAKEKDESTGFGERLKVLRKAAGLTQEQLAEKAGMRAQNITRLERGSRGKMPSWETVMRLAKALKVSTEDFRNDLGPE